MNTYLKFVNQTNKDCKEEKFRSCAMKNGHSFLEAMDSRVCSEESQCHIAFDSLKPEEKQRIMMKLAMNA